MTDHESRENRQENEEHQESARRVKKTKKKWWVFAAIFAERFFDGKEKLVSKKCKRTMEKIIMMTSIVDNTDEDDADSFFGLILDEVTRFKSLLDEKYKDYMEKEEHKLLLKKLEIIEKEMMLRKSILLQDSLEQARSKPKR